MMSGIYNTSENFERGLKMDNQKAIYNASELGKPKMAILGLQHMLPCSDLLYSFLH